MPLDEHNPSEITETLPRGKLVCQWFSKLFFQRRDKMLARELLRSVTYSGHPASVIGTTESRAELAL